MNKGTFEGTTEEILFVKKLNKKEALLFWEKLGIDPKNNWGIRIITKKFGKINEEKILPKADVFIAQGYVCLKYLINNDFYLDENDVKNFNLIPIAKSGISVKRSDSKKFQIVKISPKTFRKLFGNNILAIGASLYCNNSNEFFKNKEIINGWSESEADVVNYFSKQLKTKPFSLFSEKNSNFLKKVKSFSNNKIKEIVKSNELISNYIFYGIGNFEEPFTARWIFKNNNFEKNSILPFKVTTGSGRTKGIYTIVLKPIYHQDY